MNMEDEDFEKHLRAALKREPAPRNFAANVVASVPRKARPDTRPNRHWAMWAIAAGLAVAAIVPPAVIEHQHQQQAKAAEAKRQLLIALNVTRASFTHVREKVQRATRHTL